jgi:hypothetical protein
MRLRPGVSGYVTVGLVYVSPEEIDPEKPSASARGAKANGHRAEPHSEEDEKESGKGGEYNREDDLEDRMIGDVRERPDDHAREWPPVEAQAQLEGVVIDDTIGQEAYARGVCRRCGECRENVRMPIPDFTQSMRNLNETGTRAAADGSQRTRTSDSETKWLSGDKLADWKLNCWAPLRLERSRAM